MTRCEFGLCVVAMLAGVGVVRGADTLNLAAGPFSASPTPTFNSSNLIVHYAADSLGLADGATVANLPDLAALSGFNNAAAAGSASTFVANAVNGLPAVRFPGTGTLRAGSAMGIGSTSGFAYFAVLRAEPGGVTTGNYFWDRNTAVDNPLVSLRALPGNKYGLQKRFDSGGGFSETPSVTDISTTTFQIVTLRRNRTDDRFEIWVDGNLEGTVADGGAGLTPQPIVLGAHGGNNAGNVSLFSEVMIFNDELSLQDFLDVGTFLEFKYGLDTAFPNFVPPPLAPEPASVALFGVAVAAFGIWHYRRRKTSTGD